MAIDDYKKELTRFRRYYHAAEGMVSKQRARNYSAVIFSFLAVSLFGWYAIRPTIQTILQLRREIEDSKVTNTQMEQKITKLIEAQTAYQKIQNQIGVIYEATPENPQVLNVAASIQSLIRTSGASLSAITISNSPLLGSEKNASPSGNTNKPTSTTQNIVLKKIPVNAIVIGTYPQLASIISNLLAYRRVVTIDSISFTKSTDTSSGVKTSDNLLQLVLKLTIYYVTQ